METKFFKYARFLLFLGSGLGIIWWLYRDQDWDKLRQVLVFDVNFWWIFASLLIGLLSHVSRTIRWQMLIVPLGGRPGFVNTFLSVMIGYLANLAIPRMGEVSRCAIMSKYGKLSFSGLIGTVIAERFLDIVSLLISLLILFIFHFEFVNGFFIQSVDLSGLQNSFLTPIPYIVLFFIGASFWLFKNKIKSSRFFYRISGLWSKFREGFLSFKNVEKKGWFIFHSLIIFLLYFLMMYVCFFAFPFTGHLTPMAGFSVFVFGTLGMVAPVQGGVGPWHFMVITALIAYGIPAGEAGIFALIVHGALNAMIVIAGLVSLLVLPFLNKIST